MQKEKVSAQASKFTTEKRKKKKSAVKVVWVLVLFALVFIVIVVRFALSGDSDEIFSGMPTQDATYDVAKEFVRPTLKGYAPNFDSGFQYGKQQDSVFVIKSNVETKDNSGQVQKTSFEVTLRYKGGSVSSQNNWELLNLNED